MFRLLIVFLLFNNIAIAQKNLITKVDLSYPENSATDSIKDYITKADSLWKLYYKEGFSRVDLEYNNQITVILHFDSLGNGIELSELYPDTGGISFSYSKISDSYLLKRYEWFYGYTIHLEYWYPKENKREFWTYDEDENLKKVVKIKQDKNSKTIDITEVIDFQENTIRYVYKKEFEKWKLLNSFEVKDE